MALNKYMHPRNPFKSHKIRFNYLAEQYDFLRNIITYDDEECRYSIDFKDSRQVAALTRAILLEHFGLKITLPPNQLVPTVPLRLNYILWVEDLINDNFGGGSSLQNSKSSASLRHHLIDIGCGASCIYPLLGCQRNPSWQFIATEINPQNYEMACENVRQNGLQHRIKLVKTDGKSGDDDAILPSLTEEREDKSGKGNGEGGCIKVLMCNPPFFADSLDQLGSDRVSLRTHTHIRGVGGRDPARSNCTAIYEEAQTRGGEVGFMQRLVLESLRAPSSSPTPTSSSANHSTANVSTLPANRFALFTVMFGRKSSLVQFRAWLLSNFSSSSSSCSSSNGLQLRNTSVHQMCQGRVMRWGFCWSFMAAPPSDCITTSDAPPPRANSAISANAIGWKFRASQFEVERQRERPPITWRVPADWLERRAFSQLEVLSRLETLLIGRLRIKLLQQKEALRQSGGDAVSGEGGLGRHFLAIARHNTWANQRRLRRQQKQLANQSNDSNSSNNSGGGGENRLANQIESARGGDAYKGGEGKGGEEEEEELSDEEESWEPRAKRIHLDTQTGAAATSEEAENVLSSLMDETEVRVPPSSSGDCGDVMSVAEKPEEKNKEKQKQRL